jgi:hypothetical protein
MSADPTGAGPVPTRSAASSRRAARRRASGIYGTIITAAVLASAGGHLPTTALAIAVLLTLIVYWLAEQYAEVLGEQVEHGQLPTWARVRDGLTCTWPMVSAAYVPVLALIVCRIFNVSQTSAANVALTVATILLLTHGWSAGRAAELRGLPLVAVTLISGAFGVLMIILKNAVITSLH